MVFTSSKGTNFSQKYLLKYHDAHINRIILEQPRIPNIPPIISFPAININSKIYWETKGYITLCCCSVT